MAAIVIDPCATIRARRVHLSVRSFHHGRLVFTATPEGFYVRAEGSRDAFVLPYGVAYQRAAQLHGDRERAERAAKRKAGRPQSRARR